MIEIFQQDNFVVGSAEAIKSLSKIETAKILVLSDSHGNPHIIQSIISTFGSSCDAICFCGDGIFDFVEVLEMGFCDKDFGNKIPPVLYFVRGNGDNSTATVFTDQRISFTIPEFQEITIAGKKIFLTHGHRYGVYYGIKELRAEAISRDCDVVLYGHTHVPNAQQSQVSKDGRKKTLEILNPGSCSQGRGGMANTFAIIYLNKDDDKIRERYYEISWDRYGESVFAEIPAPHGEIHLF